MSKYTEEFRRDAIELMKKIGITKACKELNVAHCTIYRWCRELEGASADLDALIDGQINEEEPLPDPDVQEPTEAEQEPHENSDTIATAMALLVIENTHLREVIQHLRDMRSLTKASVNCSVIGIFSMTTTKHWFLNS